MKKTYATALHCALAAMLLWGVVAQAGAITITTTESEYVPGGVRYYFVVSSWGNVFNRSPCSSKGPEYTVCTIYLAAGKDVFYYNSVGTYAWWDVPTRYNSNMKELLNDLEGKGFHIPLSGSIFVASKDVSSDLCIGFGYVQTGPSIGGGLARFGDCFRVAVPMLQCDLTGDAMIDHKTLIDNAVDGATSSTQLNVQCRGPASVTVSTSTTDAYGVRLKDDGSLYSKITVNGKDATTGINVPIIQGLPTPLTVTSTLIERGNVTPGEFRGSTVVTISPP